MQKAGALLVWGFASLSMLNGCATDASPRPESKRESVSSSTSKKNGSHDRRAQIQSENPERPGYVFASWRKCADEHQRCQFVGTHTVAYGVEDQWFYRRATNGIDCNNETFGDPAFGIFKACYLTD